MNYETLFDIFIIINDPVFLMFHTGTNNNLCSQGENKLMQHDYNYKLTILSLTLLKFIINNYNYNSIHNRCERSVCFCHYFIVIVAVVVVLFKIQITIFSFADE